VSFFTSLFLLTQEWRRVEQVNRLTLLRLAKGFHSLILDGTLHLCARTTSRGLRLGNTITRTLPALLFLSNTSHLSSAFLSFLNCLCNHCELPLGRPPAQYMCS